MALYVITDGDGDEYSNVVEGLDKLKQRIKELYDDDGGEFLYQVYKLEKKMSVSIETVVTLKGE